VQISGSQEGKQKNLLYKGRIKRKKITGRKKTRPHYKGINLFTLLNIDSDLSLFQMGPADPTLSTNL
jgi:hypothetical protein